MTATEINRYEAEILLYVMPDSVAVRAKGSDVGFDQSFAKGLNERDYFYFYLYDKAGNPNGSPTVGNYAVNKHTGDVWLDGPRRMILSPQLRGVQQILRAEHHITEATIRKYRSPNF